MEYRIEFRPGVLKNLKRFPRKDLLRIKKKIEELGSNLPDPNRTKMKGNNPFHKIRTGSYRIIYETHETNVVILIVKIGHRKDVYQKLK